MLPSATTSKHRQQARSAATRAAILAAAERAFADAGLAGARTEAIAAAAGVNKAMLYYYFKSKRKLYQAVVEEHFHEFNDEAMAVLQSPGPAGEILLKYVAMHFDFMSTHRRHAPLFQQMMSGGGKSLQNLVEKYFRPRSQAMGRLLERGMRDGEFRKADRFHTAISIIGLIVFYFSAAQVMEFLGHDDAYTAANLRRRKQELLAFVRHGVFKAPKKAG